MKNISKIKPTVVTIKYFDINKLLDGLESERPGIKSRMMDWISEFSDYNNGVRSINLFYWGIGDEYPNEYLIKYPDELEHCKKTHSEAFKENSKEMDIRLDLNLIWSVYQDEIEDDDVDSFSISGINRLKYLLHVLIILQCSTEESTNNTATYHGIAGAFQMG